MTTSATDKDIENIEAWAKVIEEMLILTSPDIRSSILALAAKNISNRKLSGDFVTASSIDIILNDNTNAIMRLKGLLVQVFVRDITNNNSPDDAASILFSPQKHGHGSGLLLDYLRNLPGMIPSPK